MVGSSGIAGQKGTLYFNGIEIAVESNCNGKITYNKMKSVSKTLFLSRYD